MAGKKSIYLVCPVRNVPDDEKDNIEAYVQKLESEGHKVFYPARDTVQTNGIVDVLTDDRAGLERCDEIHVYWNGKSSGSIFDLGMAFVAYKPIYLVNREDVKPTPGKSLENFLLEMDDFYRNNR